MFGSQDMKMDQLVKKGKWKALSKAMERADPATKRMIAKACAGSKADQSANLLLELVRDPDQTVQQEAVRSLGETGNDTAKTHLQWILDHLPANQSELHQEIRGAIAKISNRSKKESEG